MKDLVNRLRARAGQYDEEAWHSEIELEAANAIESLTAALGRVIAEADGWHDDDRGGPAPGLEEERALLKRLSA